jgi:hypothetical protein
VIRRSTIANVLSVASFAAILLVFVVPAPVKLVAILVSVGLLAGQLVFRLLGFRDDRVAAQALVSAHSGTPVIPTALLEFDGVSRRDRARVLVVLADSAGLSFRDDADAVVAGLPAPSILSIELAPLGGRTLRPVVVTRADGPPVRFTVGVGDDQQAGAVIALRAALRG